MQEDLTEEKKRELEHNAEEPYGENEENVSPVQAQGSGAGSNPDHRDVT